MPFCLITDIAYGNRHCVAYGNRHCVNLNMCDRYFRFGGRVGAVTIVRFLISFVVPTLWTYLGYFPKVGHGTT